MKTVWGIMAHVDAGKTTLSEAILYNAGQLASIGRVDHGDAFLDTDSQEKNRGITIFSKPAVFQYEGESFTLLDTPGHVDFATEAERAIFALDYAILLISGTDGVQPHTRTIFRLLEENNIPILIFVNKMDMATADLKQCMSELKAELSDKCVLSSDYESMALADEEVMEEFLENDSLSQQTVIQLINARKVFPVFSGAALKNQGVEELMQMMASLSKSVERQSEFGGRIYKIESLGRDTRLTFMKVTGGSLAVKAILSNGEKVNELRIYSGLKYQQVDEVSAGDVVALVGPRETFAGQGIGFEENRPELSLTPVLSYQVKLGEEIEPRLAYPKLLALNEEDPSLQVSMDSENQITMHLMGEVQTEILINKIKNELGYEVSFEEIGVLYKETINGLVEGVGHFEPLRHYAEAHILMEPLDPGSGIQVVKDVSTDDLALNWQRLIETHILERQHLGTAIGAPLSDVRFTIIGGRAHIKHTEGGDFREATYRAIRQGLMEAGTTILEPYFRFEMILDNDFVGRAMTDVESMGGTFEAPTDMNGQSKLVGVAPAVNIRNYASKLTAYTKGEGRISLVLDGYRPCHNPDEVMEQYGYNPDADIDNPASSVFCSHGAATIVPWDEVKDNCHVPCRTNRDTASDFQDEPINSKRMNHGVDEWLDPDEIDKILSMATHSNQGKNPKKGWHYGEGSRPRRVDSDYVYTAPKAVKPRDKYLLVDGYNLIYAWPELKEVLDVNLDGARGKLLDILSNYKGMTDYNVIAVFDAYRVKGHAVTASDYLNIHQVFTAEAQTADAYIERFTHEHGKKYDITVVTSDGLEQVIIRGAGAKLMSSREFIEEVERKANELRETFGIK
ncbi:translation factor GTPase family protein [Pseudobutyrivibrio xylanivorans]|uniref:GTP-binding protein n=1 Tax=Pseudobutyrivibrio xylanivorans TaxID=185007 RepID=A0A5P6VTK4_PSEXY|nr:TetM/TetW/TetO/TetS family tetracycline resistance ribosomal protection protein [Pseudobutyrivibrio xylanivorans]QFJ55966.1 GTP-binding protein [Pseudobutyrivibrio xylanivorans]